MVVDDLIYDLGFHRGEDTAYYLRKGYRVVAFEANPDLVAQAGRRFEAELASGRLELVQGAISASQETHVTFYKNPRNSVWGTTSKDWVTRNGQTVTQIAVPVVHLEDHLRRTGTPYFVKIDIEGADRLCLEALLALEARPATVSIESTKAGFAELRLELDLLERLGFRRFAAVQQAHIGGRQILTHSRQGERFAYRFEQGSSGGFGEDIDGWAGRAEIERQYRSIFARYRRSGDGSLVNLAVRRVPVVRRLLASWYDTHAAR